MRIVQLANFVTASSGGIRTTLAALGAGYTDAGHEVVEVIAGADDHDEALADGRHRHTLRGSRLPGGGYRVLFGRQNVRDVLEQLAPDAIEVHDRFTLPWAAKWARQQGLPATVVVHERLAGELTGWAHLPTGLATNIARPFDRRLAAQAGPIVVASSYAASAFDGHPAVDVVPFGVDLQRFRPITGRRPGQHPDELRLVYVGRLSREKRPADAIAATAELHARGHHVRLDIFGEGPLRKRLEARTSRLPVRFHGHVRPDHLMQFVAAADAMLAPCRIESYGLAALESLACGTPIVVPDEGALPELLAGSLSDAGAVVPPNVARTADAVEALAQIPRPRRREAARALALARPWSRAVQHLLNAHQMAPSASRPKSTATSRPKSTATSRPKWSATSVPTRPSADVDMARTKRRHHARSVASDSGLP